MKSFVFAAAAAVLSLALANQAHAQQFFALDANCNFNAANGRCQVNNYAGQPIFCSLTAAGTLASGISAYGYNNAWIFPGQSAWVFVQASNPYQNPLIAVSGSATCRF